MKRFHLIALTVLLIGSGLTLFGYKVYALRFPLTPDLQESRWVIEAHVSFVARNQPLKVTLRIPKSNENFMIMDENFISRGFGLTTKLEDGNREAVWTKRNAIGQQGLYYRAVVRQGGLEGNWDKALHGGADDEQTQEGMRREAMKSVILEARQKSADTETFVAAMVDQLNSASPPSAVRLLLGSKPDNKRRAQVAVQILAEAGQKARIVHGVLLREPAKNMPWVPRLQIYENKSWQTYDVKTGARTQGDEFMPWWHGDAPVAEVSGGSRLRTVISMERYQEEAMVGATDSALHVAPSIVEFSLFSLPVETQRVYRVLLLVPVGAFLVVVLRNLIGITTLGTFMPVLVALAFRESEMLWGVVLFTIVVALGLAARFYLEHLKLLLVPRLAAVLTIVVLLMAVLSVVSNKLGLERGLSVALFPMVIMTMMIERLSIIWDERGAFEALKNGAGTLLTACLIYLVIRTQELQHLAFVFPELLLVLLALIVLLGRYRGYRLLELYRFRALRKREPG